MSEPVKGLAEVCHEYQMRFCVTMSRGAFDDIKATLQRGIEDKLIIEAIELAVQRGAKWQYAKSIIERLEEKDIKCMGIYHVHQEMKKLKKQFPYHSEDELKPYAIINAYRDLPEFKDIDKKIEEFVEQERKNPSYNFEEWLDKNWIEEE